MHIKNLTYLIEIEKAGSVNKASKNLNTSPQNLSRIIKQIEDEIGTELFIRNNSGMELTDNGRIFLDFCKRARNDYNCTLLEINENIESKKITGNVKFYAPSLMMEFIFNDILIRFKQHFPNINIHAIELDMKDIYDAVQNEPNAIAALPLLDFSKNYPDIEFHEFITLYTGILVSKNHHLATKSSVHIDEIMRENIIIFTVNDVTNTEPYCIIKDFINKKTHIDTTSNINAFYQHIASNTDVAFSCKESFKKMFPNDPNITLLDIDGIEDIFPYCVVENKKANHSTAQRYFLDFVKESLNI